LCKGKEGGANLKRMYFRGHGCVATRWQSCEREAQGVTQARRTGVVRCLCL
jgi:hypothetical protein